MDKFQDYWNHEGTFCDNPFTSKKDTAASAWKASAESSSKELEAAKQMVDHYTSAMNDALAKCKTLQVSLDDARAKDLQLCQRLSLSSDDLIGLQAEKEALKKKLAEQQDAMNTISDGLQIIYEAETHDVVENVSESLQKVIRAVGTEELTKLLAAARKEGFEEGYASRTLCSVTVEESLLACEAAKQAGRDELSATKDKMAMMVDALVETDKQHSEYSECCPLTIKALSATSYEVAKHRDECDAKVLYEVQELALSWSDSSPLCAEAFARFALRIAGMANELRASASKDQ